MQQNHSQNNASNVTTCIVLGSAQRTAFCILNLSKVQSFVRAGESLWLV